MITLRPYQQEAVDMIDECFRTNKRRVILWAQMGAGKSEIACHMVKRCVDYNFPAVLVVRGRELVKNLSQRLDNWKIPHSVYMADHYRYDRKKLVQVCSIDTLKSRKDFPFKDRECLMILDEQHKDYSDIYENYPNHYIIGMSATPFSDNSMYHAVVNPIKAYELRDLGYLVPEKIFVPSIMDTSQVKIRAGDFDHKQLEEVATRSAVIGNVVADYKTYGENRPAVCFCVSVEHSKRLSQAFRESGVPSIHCDAKSSEAERDSAKKGLESGAIKVVCNVDIFSVGWDCASVSCIILARPTWSLVWYLQAVGRGIRSKTGKENCIVLDNAGNVFRHGTIYQSREVHLKKPEKSKREYDVSIKTCKKCFYVYDAAEERCPACDFKADPTGRKVLEIDGKLIEYDTETDHDRIERLKKSIVKEYYQLEWVRKTKNLNKLFPIMSIKKKYGGSKFYSELIAHLGETVHLPQKEKGAF